MAQRIIVIHGRNTKPAQKAYEKLQFKALLQGVNRVNPTQAGKIQSKIVKVSFVYYGDINNAILAEKQEKKLTAVDPKNNKPCLPHDGVEDNINALSSIRRLNKQAYLKILRENKDRRWLDDAAWALSTISSLLTVNTLNEKVIKKATADMGAYLLIHEIGSQIRKRLQSPLIKAFGKGDDICLIAHSMGTIVSYDVLWKISHMSEYASVMDKNPMVNLWLTLGCPLGEAGVRQNLRDANVRSPDKFPKNIIKNWANIAARDDFVAHDSTMKNDFINMKKSKYIEEIKYIIVTLKVMSQTRTVFTGI